MKRLVHILTIGVRPKKLQAFERRHPVGFLVAGLLYGVWVTKTMEKLAGL